jgi:hypothetical protein
MTIQAWPPSPAATSIRTGIDRTFRRLKARTPRSSDTASTVLVSLVVGFYVNVGDPFSPPSCSAPGTSRSNEHLSAIPDLQVSHPSGGNESLCRRTSAAANVSVHCTLTRTCDPQESFGLSRPPPAKVSRAAARTVATVPRVWVFRLGATGIQRHLESQEVCPAAPTSQPPHASALYRV